jgi:activator of HSP90 ATPase
MTRVIHQSVRFPATPAQLYELFMDSKKHVAATGMPTKVSRKVGGKWSAFGGSIDGRNLLLIPGKMIVQSWRGPWNAGDADSILVVSFRKVLGGAQVDLVHVGVPGHDYEGVSRGWPKFYWKPWREYLAKRKKTVSAPIGLMRFRMEMEGVGI